LYTHTKIVIVAVSSPPILVNRNPWVGRCHISDDTGPIYI